MNNDMQTDSSINDLTISKSLMTIQIVTLATVI